MKTTPPPAYTLQGVLFYVPEKPAAGVLVSGIWIGTIGGTVPGIGIFVHLGRDRADHYRCLYLAEKMLVIILSPGEYALVRMLEKE